MRRELTYTEFASYLLKERRGYAEEATVAAYGTAAAIAEVLGGKKSKAMKKFAKALKPAEATESPSPSRKSPGGLGIETLKSRVKAAMAAGEF